MDIYHLAIDIGASGGRHILGHLDEGKIKLEEVWRFENRMKEVNGKFLWDLEELFSQIVTGMRLCKKLGKIPVSVSIDTWAVDYVLLDERNQVLGNTYGYRDKRTEGIDKEVYQIISETNLYKRTGIQKQIFNTIYQLMAMKKQTPWLLEKADSMLLLPDYFHFCLTGTKFCEYTNATTTQLVSPTTKDWDWELIKMLELPRKIFLPISFPGKKIGILKAELERQIGYSCQVVLGASHDTASAVMAVPDVERKGIYISSGTWSLMGVELKDALCDEKSKKSNFTNEGGFGGCFRYLKNIMGLWMIQSLRRELKKNYTFMELCEMAEVCRDFPSRIDVNDKRFLAPESMIEEVKKACCQTRQLIPEAPGELAAVIYGSLADYYAKTVDELERNTSKNYEGIYIVGGGSNAGYLNQMTAQSTGKIVYAGPGEATAVGNLISQMMVWGEFKNLEQARMCVKHSFAIKTFFPIK